MTAVYNLFRAVANDKQAGSTPCCPLSSTIPISADAYLPVRRRERQKRFRDKQKQLKQEGSATQAVLQAAASAPGGFDAASALQHAHSLAAYGIADPAAIAQAIMAIALPESGYSGKASQPAANAQQQQLPAEPSFDGIADDGAGQLLAGAQAAAAAAHAAMLTSGGVGPSTAPRAAKRMRMALAAASGGGAASGGTDVDVNVDVGADVGGDDSTNGDAERPSPDAEGREELHAMSSQLAAGFCEATSALDARACAAVLRGFLASVRGALGDEVHARVHVLHAGAVKQDQ